MKKQPSIPSMPKVKRGKRTPGHQPKTDKRGERVRPYQWKPGQSGNPSGCPKGIRRIKDLLNHFGSYKCPKETIAEVRKRFPGVNQLDLQEAVMLKTYAAALDGEAWALEFVAERTEGKVPQGLQHLIQNPVLNVEVSDSAAAAALQGLAGGVDNV